MIDRLEQTLTTVEFKKNTAIQAVHKRGEKYDVVLDHETIAADVVVLATPNQTVRAVLQDPVIDEQLEKFTNASALTMYVGFDVADSVLPADGTYFIVSHHSDLVCNASTWTSRKWKHTSAEGNLLVRLFYKNINPRYEQLAAMTDEELTQVALEDIKLSLGIEAEPTVVKVTKWIDKMPRYDLAHNEALGVVVRELAQRYPNVLLAGCSYFGVGIGACIQNGKKTADQILSKII